VFGKAPGDAQRTVYERELFVTLRLGNFDATLDIPDRIEIRPDLELVTRTKLTAESRDIISDRIENTPLLLSTRSPSFRVGAIGIPKQPLKHRTRVVLHR
jgi:hypothetical protein